MGGSWEQLGPCGSLQRKGARPRGTWATASAPGPGFHLSARRLGRASVLGPGRAENLITKSYHLSYCSIKLTVTPPYPTLLTAVPTDRGVGEISINFIEIFSCCDFFGILVAFIFSSFFVAFFDRSWIDVPSQLASQNPLKSIKIVKKSMPRCLPMLRSLFHRFLIDFLQDNGEARWGAHLATK